MFNETDCVLSPRIFEYTLFDNADVNDKMNESTNFIMTKGGQVKISNPISIKEVMFPAFYPFKVRSIKKINDLYEIFITSPDSFNYTDEHFNMMNYSILEHNDELPDMRSVFKLADLKNFDELLPLKQSDPDFFYEIYYYNLYHKNLIALTCNNITIEVKLLAISKQYGNDIKRGELRGSSAK